MTKKILLTLIVGVIGFLLTMIGIFGNQIPLIFGYDSDWLILPGILLLGVSFGYYFIGRRLPQLTVPISKYNLRRREDMNTLFALSAATPKETQKKPKNSTDSYSFIQLERKFYPIDYNNFSNLQGRMETKHEYHHYEEVTLSKYADFFSLSRYHWIVVLTGILLTIILLTVALWTSNIGNKQILELMLSAGIIVSFIVLVILGSWFFGVVRNLSQEGLKDEELIEPISSASGFVSFFLGFVGLVLLYLYGYDQGWITFGWSSNDDWLIWMLLIMLSFPLWFVNLLQGKYFSMWAVNLVSKTKNWDFIQGKLVTENTKGIRRIIDYVKRIIAIIGLIVLFYGVIRALLDIFKVFTTENPLVDSGVLDNVITIIPGPTILYIFFLGLGPLLILLIKPFDLIEVWIHQGILDKINSEWDPEKTKEYQLYFNDVARFPPIDNRFMANLARMTSLILVTITILGLSTIISEIWAVPEWLQLVWLGQLSGEIVFLSYVIINTLSLKEEKTISLMAKYSRKLRRNLFNETMYGEWLIVSQLDITKKLEGMRKWVASYKDEWVLSNLFLGYLLSKIEDSRGLTAEEKEEQLLSYTKAIQEQALILPSMKTIAKKNHKKLTSKK